MHSIPIRAAIFAVAMLAGLAEATDRPPSPGSLTVEVPAGIDHDALDDLLRQYVDDKGLVAYERWAANGDDRARLDRYLAQLARSPEEPATGNDRVATLINAYNASTIDWILDNYPAESIRSLPRSFDGRRHRIGGRLVSLDDIEHGTLRPLMGHRTHVVLVCAARSCPPLASQAYRPENLDDQIDRAFRRWLAREDLNRFDPNEGTARISEIFRWFAEDFERAGGLQEVLSRHAPPGDRSMFDDRRIQIEFLTYDWGLNDQGGLGRNYSRTKFYLDGVKSLFD